MSIQSIQLVGFTDTAIAKVVFDLDNISKIQRNQVISTTSEYINVEDISYSTSLSRTFTGDSRDKGVARARERVQTAYEFAERLLESKYVCIYSDLSRCNEISVDHYENFQIRFDWIMKIRDSLFAVPAGLFNMKTTYEKDLDTVGSINELIKDTKKKANIIKVCVEELLKAKEDFEYVKKEFGGSSFGKSQRTIGLRGNNRAENTYDRVSNFNMEKMTMAQSPNFQMDLVDD